MSGRLWVLTFKTKALPSLSFSFQNEGIGPMSLNSLPTSTICGPTSGTLMVKKQKITSGPEKVSGPRLYRTHIPISHSSPKAAEPDSSASCWDL